MRLVLLFLCLFEVLNITWFGNWAGPYVSPVLLLAASVSIGAIYLKLANQPWEYAEKRPILPIWAVRVLQAIIFLGLTYYAFAKLKHIWWYEQMYGDHAFISDIIPQIQTLVQRFLAGEQPYKNIHFPGYSLFPTYLPMQWMPYITTELAHKDYRWIPTLSVWLACLWHFLKRKEVNGSLPVRLLIPSWPLIVWLACILSDNGLFLYTVEGLVAGYYFLVSESVVGKRFAAAAIGISLCLLSRYSIVFWVPLALFVLYVSGMRRQAWMIAGVAAAALFFFYWLPFLRVDPGIYSKGFAYHTNAAFYEWQRSLALLPEPGYLYNGLGFTAFVDPAHGNLQSKLMLYKRIHVGMCLLVTIGMGFLYWRKRHEYSVQSFLLFSLKVYLTVFYAFIQIPYKYLMLVPVLVSATLLGEAFMPRLSGTSRVNKSKSLANAQG